MSTFYVVAIKDVKAEVFLVPAFVGSTYSAIRSFGDQINHAADDNILYKHPEDFALYQLGVFEDDTGIVTPYSTPLLLANGSDSVRPKVERVGLTD